MYSMIIILVIIGAALYTILPFDLLPDYILGWGWIDDLAILYMAWRYYRRLKQQRAAGRPGTGPGPEPGAGGSSGDGQFQGRGAENIRSKSPYEVLELSPGASPEEIKAAYRRLAGKYHPDKVQHLGEDFQKLAEARFKDIQWAYDELRAR